MTNPPATAKRGTKFKVTDTVKNQGSVATKVSTTRYYLSAEWTADTRLTGTHAVPALNPGATNTKTVTVTIPTKTGPGAYHLIVCVDDTGGESRKHRDQQLPNVGHDDPGNAVIRGSSTPSAFSALTGYRATLEQKAPRLIQCCDLIPDPPPPARHRPTRNRSAWVPGSPAVAIHQGLPRRPECSSESSPCPCWAWCSR